MAVKGRLSTPPLPFSVTEACTLLGARIAVARKRRRLTQKEVARRAGLSTFTLIRVEKGVASTELGSIVRVLWALGLDSTLALVADSLRDEVGQGLERSRLPQRISHRRAQLDDDF